MTSKMKTDPETVAFITGVRHALQSAHQALTDAAGGNVSKEACDAVHTAIMMLESAKKLAK